MEAPRRKQRGALLNPEAYSLGLSRWERLAELFSCLFYVAASRLNSPRFVEAIETFAGAHVKKQ